LGYQENEKLFFPAMKIKICAARIQNSGGYFFKKQGFSDRHYIDNQNVSGASCIPWLINWVFIQLSLRVMFGMGPRITAS